MPFDRKPRADGALHAPATLRNRGPLLAVLQQVLPPEGDILEIASGTGEHATFFAAALPGVQWLPTDVRQEHLTSISAWTAEAGTTNVAPPVYLDVEQDPWPIERAAAVVNANMIHIAPFFACEALMRGAARVLASGAPLLLYGPFMRDGQHTAESNARFDERLRAENPGWGVRDLREVDAVAARHGLHLEQVYEMPANNLTVVWRRA